MDQTSDCFSIGKFYMILKFLLTGIVTFPFKIAKKSCHHTIRLYSLILGKPILFRDLYFPHGCDDSDDDGRDDCNGNVFLWLCSTWSIMLFLSDPVMSRLQIRNLDFVNLEGLTDNTSPNSGVYFCLGK